MNIILCGLGGQGILFMTRILAQTALDKGFEVIGAESHGMAQRGGSVVSHLRIGKAESSLVMAGSAHALLALEENEGYRNLPFLSPGSRLYVNTDSRNFPRSEVESFLKKREIIYRSVPANPLAMELGAPMASNIVFLGYFSAFEEGPLGHGEMRNTVERVSPERFKEVNLNLFSAGYQKGLKDL